MCRGMEYRVCVERELCRWVCEGSVGCGGGGVCRVHVVRGVWRGVCTQSGWRVVVCRCVCGEGV